MANRETAGISRVRIERVASRVTAIFALLYVMQCLPAVLDSARYLTPLGYIGIPIAIYGSILAAAAAAILTRAVRLTAGIQAVVLLIVLILWPVTVRDVGVMGSLSPWLWYVITLGMAFAVISFPVFVAAIYISGVPVLFALLRVLPEGGGAPWAIATLDAVYALILGAFALILISTLRIAAGRVDEVRLSAAEVYGVAIRGEAREAQRARVDAILHDHVLATLLVAGKSETAMERSLSVDMAEKALDKLEAAGPLGADLQSTTLVDIGERLERAAAQFPAEVSFAHEGVLVPPGLGVPVHVPVPGHVAEAIVAAVTQAILNSVQHAGARGVGTGPGAGRGGLLREPVRSVSLHPLNDSGFTIVVADSGAGFDAGAVSAERLGLRVSIRERIAAVGGRVAVNSIPGAGTSIVITWLDPSA